MDMQNITKITLAWELHEAGLLQKDITKKLEINRDTVRIWLKNIEEAGLLTFLDQYQKAKKGERRGRQVGHQIKQWIWDIRENKRDCCGQKIRYYLYCDHQIRVSVPKIYEILAEKYQIKSKWKKSRVTGPVPKAYAPREVIQMDTVDFGEVFAFTAVDIFSKEIDVLLRPSLTSRDGLIFLETAMNRRFNSHSNLIQADGGPEFKDEFKANVYRFTDRYRVARPYKKNEQSFIESFNRSLRKECLGWSKYKVSQISELTKEVEDYLSWYHYDRPHLGLNLKPPLSIT